MTVTSTQIKNMVGQQAWNAIDGTTTTIVNDLISVAENDTSDITGTTTGYDGEIKFRSSALVINQIMSGLGPETIGDKEMEKQRTYFEDQWARKLKQKGYSVEGLRILADQVNG